MDWQALVSRLARATRPHLAEGAAFSVGLLLRLRLADSYGPQWGWDATPHLQYIEYLAETVLAMSHLPAAERTGLVAFSLHYPWSQNVQVHSLDGTGLLPPLEPPATANPNILPAGV